MIQFGNNGLPYLRFESFLGDERLSHAVFTRVGGSSPAPFDSLNLSASVPDSRANVYENRTRAYGTHGRATESLVHAHLAHGAEVAIVGSDDYGRHVGPVDGLITAEKGCGLTMNFADCAPIMLFDPVNGAIGLGHAGWRGAVADLPGAMVRAMQRSFRSEPDRLLAAIGPAIGPCCYEVGDPVVPAVRETFSDSATLLLAQENSDRPHFDLPEANRRRLRFAGVEQIEMSPLCTACSTDMFFSHRAEGGRTGRFGTLLILS